MGSPDESLQTLVNRSVKSDPESADTWAADLHALQATTNAGKTVSVPGTAADGSAVEQSQAIADALATVERSAAQSSSQPRIAASGLTYQLRGVAINSNATWQMNTEIDGGRCTPDGCDITDKTRQTWKISPGYRSDKFNFTSVRTGAGHLTKIYAYISALCNGSACGDTFAGKGGPEDGSGSGNVYLDHPTSAAGKGIVSRVQMEAYFTPNKTTYYDSAKTGTAKCGAGSNLNCRY